MIISIGFIRSAGQVLIKELDCLQNSTSTKIIDVTDLADENIQGLFIDDNDHFNSLVGILEKEKSYYPILEAQSENLTLSQFESMGAQAFKDLFFKISARWCMHQNFTSLENMYGLVNHFKDLWKKDRITFFEEMWYWFKRNVGATDLTIVFNDVISSEEKDENNEKKDRPKLVQSLLTGTKKANFHQGGAKEKELMQTYLDKFHEIFEITEFAPNKFQFVATAQVERSPMIFMARVAQLNQFQRSLLAAIFNGLQ